MLENENRQNGENAFKENEKRHDFYLRKQWPTCDPVITIF